MDASPTRPSAQEVLESFAMEQVGDQGVLAKYLHEYPEHAEALVDLSHEIFLMQLSAERGLSESDTMRIDSAWTAFSASVKAADADPLADVAVEKLRELSQRLDVPRQVTLAIAERAVRPETIPLAVMAVVAMVLGASIERLKRSLSEPRRAYARSFKADGKPEVQPDKIPFHQLLRDAGVPEARIEQLVSEDR